MKNECQTMASYTGIDIFRLIAAILIISIHTLSAHKMGGWILTRVVARVGVPFFFMTSGFFLVSKTGKTDGKLKKFLKKTVIIYGISSMFYLPILIYNGYFSGSKIVFKFIKDVVFDGMFYHLWYLPASMFGGIISWYMIKKCGFKVAVFVSFLLYVIGLFGDSYYGMIENVKFMKNVYDLIFLVSDHTRNGLFFAPIFFVMGGAIAHQKREIIFKNILIGFVCSFLGMFLEASILHYFNFVRHDSMYIFLLPTMYFLYQIFLRAKGKRHKYLRTVSLWMYVLHPFTIVCIHFMGKCFELERWLIGNSCIHFLLVVMITLICSYLITFFLNEVQENMEHQKTKMARAWIEINETNLKYNLQELKRVLPCNTEVMAVVKADAYGHGGYEIASYLNKLKIKYFAVATIEEGIKLRKKGIKGEILILGYTSPFCAKELHRYDLTQTLLDNVYAKMLNAQGYHVKAHIKIDTGMHRLGFDWREFENIKKVFSLKYITVTGIFTHLCVADSLLEKDILYTKEQISRFYELVNQLEQDKVKVPKIHIQSSYGILNHENLCCDYVRVGIAMYGVLSDEVDKVKNRVDLRPVLSLKAKIVLIRIIEKGECVGYGRSFVADRETKIAVLSIGYADGYPRNLSEKNCYVLINGRPAQIVGRICMDQMCVDVTDISDVCVGMVATLIGQDGTSEISVTMIAKQAETITNEILSRMGKRLPIVVEKSKT